MRIFFCLFLFALTAPSRAEVLKQDNHRRMTFKEDYSGYYVIGTYMKNLDKVRFDACEGNPAQCTTIAELSYTKLERLKEPMLAMLRKYRAEVDEKKNSFWFLLSRVGLKSTDMEAIDQMIGEIEQHGSGNLVLLTDENIGGDAPTLNTPEFARELAARMKAVLESGAPTGEVDCVPYLRQQGL